MNQGLKCRWPKVVEWVSVELRVRDMRNELEDIIDGKIYSYFNEYTKEDFNERGMKAATALETAKRISSMGGVSKKAISKLFIINLFLIF